MDGKAMLRALRELLGESSTSGWMDDYTSYTYLNQAAIDFVQRTECLRSEQTLTTVASQREYKLAGDFLQLYMKDNQNVPFVKFYDGTNYSWLYYRDYQSVYLANNTTSVSHPSTFTVTDDDTLTTRVDGSATATGAATYGACTLTDSAGTFVTSGVCEGDTIYNHTDGSNGIVLTVSSETALICALFGGTNNDWTSGDTYSVRPKHRWMLVLDPPSSTAGYTITVPYVQLPQPVYNDHRKWRIPDYACFPIVQYAAFLYKYRDREPQYGDAFYKGYMEAVRRMGARINEGIKPKDQLRVNFMGRK